MIKSLKNLFKDLKVNITSYNNEQLLAGISLLMLNIGSKYLIIDLSKGSQQLLKLKIIRRFTLFCIFFMGTLNITLSFLLTACFIIFADGLFNEKSKFCILPKKILDNIDVNDDEYQQALETVKRYQDTHDLNKSNALKNNTQ